MPICAKLPEASETRRARLIAVARIDLWVTASAVTKDQRIKSALAAAPSTYESAAKAAFHLALYVAAEAATHKHTPC
jgi:thioredoxin-like negative regulator of GroEL